MSVITCLLKVLWPIHLRMNSRRSMPNGTHHVLAALRDSGPHCRFYFSASSEMFGKVAQVAQNEPTPFHPRSAYGISKVAGFHLTRNYREANGIKASSGILYKHESPRREFEFVTRKITHMVLVSKWWRKI